MGFLLLLGACRSSKPPILVNRLPEPVIPPAPKVFACGFKAIAFEGRIPCFGNDCGDNGAPITTLRFGEDHTLVKVLDNGLAPKSIHGGWSIDDQCLITVVYPDNTKAEYYLIQNNNLLRLSEARTAYNGAFKDQYILHPKN